jgi:hypothetical protein
VIDIEPLNFMFFQRIKGTATSTIIVSVIDEIGTCNDTIENHSLFVHYPSKFQ